MAFISYCATCELGLLSEYQEVTMELVIAAAFVVGMFIGMCGGILVLSLCAMAGSEDTSLGPALTPSTK
jgi:hypothetical protein